jgi:hypothetical protein
MPAGPGDIEVDLFGVADDRDGDLVDQEAQQVLAVGDRGARRGPQAGQVIGEGSDGTGRYPSSTTSGITRSSNRCSRW